MEEKLKACVYTRVSTERQGEDNKVSLPEQERRGKAYIEASGWEYIGTYEDNGISGKKMENRPALQRMLKDIDGGKIDVVVIYKLDRLSRKQKDTIILIEDVFKTKHIGLASVCEKLDTTTNVGLMMISVLAAFNQLECDTINERTKMGRDAKAKMGKYVGGKPPIGYKLVDGKFVIVPKEAEIVRLIFALDAAGNTLVEIADYLNNKGYRSKKGNKFQFSAIRSILANKETYEGTYKFGDHKTPNAHEPILMPNAYDGGKNYTTQTNAVEEIIGNGSGVFLETSSNSES